MQVASSLAAAIQPSSGASNVSSTQSYNTAYAFTAAAAKAQRVQPSLSAQVLQFRPWVHALANMLPCSREDGHHACQLMGVARLALPM